MVRSQNAFTSLQYRCDMWKINNILIHLFKSIENRAGIFVAQNQVEKYEAASRKI